MDKNTAQAYKRKCFQGRGILARWLDWTFFSGLGGVCLYILTGRRLPSLLLSLALLLFLVLWAGRRWARFRHTLRQTAESELRREDWMKEESSRIRQGEGIVLFPAPDRESLTGLCLRMGPGTTFHCFGPHREELSEAAAAMGCLLTFHPWGEGAIPSEEQVTKRVEQNTPRAKRRPWPQLLQLPGNRYMLTGCLLLILSLFLRRALYWRLLGSLCLLIGALGRSFRILAKS